MFDPFAGGCYVPSAAESLDRQWLACDVSPRAYTAFVRQYESGVQRITGIENGAISIDAVNVRGPHDLPERVSQREMLELRHFPQPTYKPKPGHWSEAEQKARMAQLSGWACWACGYTTRTANGKLVETTDHLHYDHIYPNSKLAERAASAGQHFHNRALLCQPCNLEKSNRIDTIENVRAMPGVVKRRHDYEVNEHDLAEPLVVHHQMMEQYVEWQVSQRAEVARTTI